MEKKNKKVINASARCNKSIEKEVLENRNSKKIEDIELDVISPKKKLFNGKTSNLKVKYKQDKKKYLLIVSSLFFVMALICGTSYAYLTYVGKTDNTTKIKVGTLAMTLKNESNEIVLEGAVPQEDKYALENNKEYEFTVENQGSLDSVYKIKLNNICNLSETFNVNGEDITPDKCVPNEHIKVGLKKTDNTYKEGTLKGNPDINGATLSSDGMEFDGDDYIDMGNANYNFGSSITVAARFNTKRLGSNGTALIDNWKTGGFEFYVSKNGNICFQVLTSTSSSLSDQKVCSNTIPALNTWNIAVATYDGITMKLYLNGNLEATFAISDTITISDKPILIGHPPYALEIDKMSYIGTISDALVIDDVLTEEEIEENYSGQFNYFDNDKTLFYQNWNEKLYSDYDVLEYNEEYDSYILDQDVLKPNEERTYKMKIWLDYDTPNDYNSQNMYNIVYAGALAVEYEQTKYKEVDVSYKVSYGANGGIGNMEDQTFAKGDKKALSKNTFTKEGYTFIGWSTSSNDTVKYSDEEIVSNLANIENKVVKLYAVWSNNPQTVNVSVTTNDTEEIERLVDYGGDTNILLNATGYNNPSVTCTNNIGAGVRNNLLKVSNVTSDTTCDVVFAPNTYTIEYDLNGGEVGVSLPEEATYDEEITISNPTKEGYGFAGWTSDDIDTKTAYYGETAWTDGKTKASSATFKNLTSENNGKVTLKANWDNDVYTVKYDANGGTGTMDESYHAYGISSTLSKNIFTKEGYSFVGWSKDKDAITATYHDEASVLNIVDEGETEATLYAVWQLKTKAITIKIAYDTSTYSGPSSTYKTDTYQSLSKTSTTLNYGASETITASPAYPDDRYTGSVSCTNGITATIEEGTGTTTRTDTIELTNNSDTTTASLCTITYTPKWQGIAYGSYTAGNTVTYSGTSWTVKADNGGNTGLVLNSTAGSGAYKSNVKTELANKLSTDTAISDANNGGLIAQSNGYYVTTNGGISTGLTDKYYYTDSTHFYNMSARTYYNEPTNVSYLYGSANTRGDGAVGVSTVKGSISQRTTSTVGIKALSEANEPYFKDNNNGTITFYNIGYTTTKTSSNHSLDMTRFILGYYCSDDRSSTQICYRINMYTFSNGSYTLTQSADMKHVARAHAYICGGTYEGKQVVYRYKSSTAFYYGNQPTGYGWSGSSWAVANAETLSYVYDDTYWNGRYAGFATTCGNMAASADNCTYTTVDGLSRTIRYYRFDTYLPDNGDDYCKKRNIYTPYDDTETLYYRPYLIARER